MASTNLDIQYLPNEICLHICSFLHLKDLFILELCSKRCQEIVNIDELFILYKESNYSLLELYPMTFHSFDLARRLYGQYPERLSLPGYFGIACEKNYLRLANWMYESHYQFHVNKRTYKHFFIEVCKKNYLEMAEWLLETYMKKLVKTNETFFFDIMDIVIKNACDNNQLVILRLSFDKIFSQSDTNCKAIKKIKNNMSWYFHKACYAGHLDIAKYIYCNYEVNELEEKLISRVTQTGNTALLQWIYSILSEEDLLRQSHPILARMKEATIEEIIFVIRESKYIGDIFEKACDHKRIDIVKYILENHFDAVTDKDSKDDEEVETHKQKKIFKKILRLGAIDIIKLFHEKVPYIINSINTYHLFNYVLGTDNIEIIQWAVLIKGNPKFESHQLTRLFDYIVQCKKIISTKWLIKNYPNINISNMEHDVYDNNNGFFDRIKTYYGA